VNHRVSMCIPACTPLAMFCLCNGGERSLRQSGHQGICAVEGQVNELLVVDWRGHSGASIPKYGSLVRSDAQIVALRAKCAPSG
jgi:hypothetical protein